MQNLLLSWASWVSCRHPCFKNLTSFPNFSWFCPSDLTNNTWVLNRQTGIWPPKNVTLLRPTQPAKATRYGMIFRIWRSNYIHINFPKNPMFCSLATYLTMCSFHWFKHFFAPEKISRCATLPVIQPEIPTTFHLLGTFQRFVGQDPRSLKDRGPMGDPTHGAMAGKSHQKWGGSRGHHWIILPIIVMLVGGWPTHLEKYEFVSWEGFSQIVWKIKHVWNHQPDYESSTYGGIVKFCDVWLPKGLAMRV